MSAPVIAHAEITTTAVQVKPWGHELIFATGENGYVGKLISVTAGQALSLQFHVAKDETISVVSGRARFEFGSDADSLETRDLGAGDTIHVPASVVHRITALSDLLFAEASTAAPGWREDVVRLADRYGRSGTQTP
jgi:mannose-6-phosphate isomerase-like protein (cupin superfamily)